LPSELSRSRKALGLVARDLKADFAKGWLDETFRNNALGHELGENVSRQSDLVQQQNMEQAGQRLRYRERQVLSLCKIPRFTH
jgi:hypothetical protein